MDISPDQIRAARALLRLEQGQLAERAHVSVVTIRRIEAADGGARVATATLDEVRQALERAGVEFIQGGVRRRPAVRPDAETRYQQLRSISRRSGEQLRGHAMLTEADLYDEDGLPA
jgi:transcriptional regulator with XRE-family HTH domain